MKRPRCVSILSALYVFLLIGTSITAAAADNPFVGHWALTIPGVGLAGWVLKSAMEHCRAASCGEAAAWFP